MNLFELFSWRLVAVAALALPTSAPAAIIYRESFAQVGTVGADQPLSTAGWAAKSHDANGVVIDASSGSQGTAIARSAGGPTTQAQGVNDGSATGGTNGFLLVSTNAASTPALPILAYTSEGTMSQTFGDLNSISWLMGNSSTASAFRAAIQVGGQWYVSSNTITQTTAVTSAGNFNTTNAQTVTFNFTGAGATAWQALTVTNGQAFAIGAAAAPAATGAVGAWGVYTDNATGNSRIDGFAIDSNAPFVPEPGILGLAALSGVGILRRRRA